MIDIIVQLLITLGFLCVIRLTLCYFFPAKKTIPIKITEDPDRYTYRDFFNEIFIGLFWIALIQAIARGS